MKAMGRPTPEGRRAEKAFQRAVARVIEENRRLGIPIAVMKDGKAVLVHLPLKKGKRLRPAGR